MIDMVGGVLLTFPSHQQITTTTTPTKSPNYKPTSLNNEKLTPNSSNKYINSNTSTTTNTTTTTNTKSKSLLHPLPSLKIRTKTLNITLRIMTMRISLCCLIERVFFIYFPSYLIVSFGWITLFWIYSAFVSNFGCLKFFNHVWVFPLFFCKK